MHHVLTIWSEDVWEEDVWVEDVWTEDVTSFTCPTVSFTSLPRNMTLKSSPRLIHYLPTTFFSCFRLDARTCIHCGYSGATSCYYLSVSLLLINYSVFHHVYIYACMDAPGTGDTVCFYTCANLPPTSTLCYPTLFQFPCSSARTW